MRGVIALLASLGAGVSASGQTYGGGAVVPSGGGVLPGYFSGTLNVASGSVYVLPPPYGFSWITKVELFLGNPSLGFTRVANWEHVPGEPATVAKGLDVTFDSTHFPDGEAVHVVVTGEDSFGQHYQAMGQAPAKNFALLGNDGFTTQPWHLPPPPTQSYSAVRSKLQAAAANYGVGKYRIWSRVWDAFVAEEWRSLLGGANFVYVTGHGTPDIYEMDDGTYFQDENGASEPNSHFVVLRDSVGAAFTATTYPPYNPSGVPPCNFMFLDTCDTLSADFSHVLYPFLNLYDGAGSPAPLNQFVGGWKVKTSSHDSRYFAQVLMGYIASGWTARNAVWKMAEVAGQAGKKVWNTQTTITPAHTNMFGDPFTKACGVYTGLPELDDTQLDTRWHR